MSATITAPSLATLCHLYAAAVASGDERAIANVVESAARWGYPTSLLTAALRGMENTEARQPAP